MGQRVALIEPNNYHGEVLPTLAYLLKELGYDVTVYATPFIRSQNPFVNLSSLDVEFKEFDGNTGALAGYDMHVWSSIEPQRNISLFQSTRKPSLAVVHDGQRIMSDDYKEIVSASNFRAITLSKHFGAYLEQLGVANSCIFPVYFHDGSLAGKTGTNVFCVQGKVEFKRRNYESIINAVAQLEKNSVNPNFKIKLLGKNNSIEGYLLRLRVLLSKGRKHFEIAGVQPDYKEFYGHLLDSEFICPLIDRSKEKYGGYFVDTSSSSIPMGLGHGLIPLLHYEFASLYGLEEISITYKNGGLIEAMKKAINMSDDQREGLRAQLKSYKEKELQRSLNALESAIRNVLN